MHRLLAVAVVVFLTAQDNPCQERPSGKLLRCKAFRNRSAADVLCQRNASTDGGPPQMVDCGVTIPQCSPSVEHSGTVCLAAADCEQGSTSPTACDPVKAGLTTNCAQLEQQIRTCIAPFETACTASSRAGPGGWPAGSCRPTWTMGNCNTRSAPDNIARDQCQVDCTL